MADGVGWRVVATRDLEPVETSKLSPASRSPSSTPWPSSTLNLSYPIISHSARVSPQQWLTYTHSRQDPQNGHSLYAQFKPPSPPDYNRQCGNHVPYNPRASLGAPARDPPRSRLKVLGLHPITSAFHDPDTPTVAASSGHRAMRDRCLPRPRLANWHRGTEGYPATPARGYRPRESIAIPIPCPLSVPRLEYEARLYRSSWAFKLCLRFLSPCSASSVPFAGAELINLSVPCCRSLLSPRGLGTYVLNTHGRSIPCVRADRELGMAFIFVEPQPP